MLRAVLLWLLLAGLPSAQLSAAQGAAFVHQQAQSMERCPPVCRVPQGP